MVNILTLKHSLKDTPITKEESPTQSVSFSTRSLRVGDQTEPLGEAVTYFVIVL